MSGMLITVYESQIHRGGYQEAKELLHHIRAKRDRRIGKKEAQVGLLEAVDEKEILDGLDMDRYMRWEAEIDRADADYLSFASRQSVDDVWPPKSFGEMIQQYLGYQVVLERFVGNGVLLLLSKKDELGTLTYSFLAIGLESCTNFNELGDALQDVNPLRRDRRLYELARKLDETMRWSNASKLYSYLNRVNHLVKWYSREVCGLEAVSDIMMFLWERTAFSLGIDIRYGGR